METEFSVLCKSALILGEQQCARLTFTYESNVFGKESEGASFANFSECDQERKNEKQCGEIFYPKTSLLSVCQSLLKYRLKAFGKIETIRFVCRVLLQMRNNFLRVWAILAESFYNMVKTALFPKLLVLH